MKLALHENKMVYDIVEHGNNHVPEIESKPVRLCPECFSDELKIVEDKCNKEVYKCQNCNCRFQVTEMRVSTKLFDILSDLFPIGVITLFITSIITGTIFISGGSEVIGTICIISFISCIVFAIIYSLFFNDFDDYLY